MKVDYSRLKTTAPLSKMRPAILLFGDSITQFGYGESIATNTPPSGWASLLSSAYSRRADIINRGYSGYNTRHALDVLPSALEGLDGRDLLYCTVFFGANDAALPGTRQNVPVEEYSENVKEIVRRLR